MLCKFSVAVLLLTFGCLTSAQIPFPRQCPNVNVMDEFNLDAYMGIWYEYAKYPFVFEIGKKCMYARYENMGNNTVSVVNTGVNRFTGTRSNVTGTAKVIAPASLAVAFYRSQNTDKPNYLVLGTDYSSYAVVYSCANVTTFAHTKIVWILTRERKPTQETINTAKKVLKDNEITESFLMETTQDDCPEVTLTTKVDATDVNASAGDDATVAPYTEIVIEALTNELEQANVIDKA